LDCSKRIKIIFEFKSACLHVEDFITPFVNAEEKNLIDLKQIYLRARGSQGLIDALRSRNLCRLCMSVVGDGSVYLNGSHADIKHVRDTIKRCIPEVERSICEVQNLNLGDSPLKLFVNRKDSGNHYSDTADFHENVGHGGSAKLKVHLKRHNMCIHKNPLEIEWFKCHLCDYKAKHKTSLETHMLIHKNPSEIEWFKCDLCDFKAKQKGHLKTHTLIHKNPAEIKWFKCDLCDFKAKRKGHLKTHTLIHKNPSEIEWFKCDLCDFKAKQKSILRTHTLIHKTPSEIEWFKCDLCDFKAKRKGTLKRHMLIHKNPSEIEWFECHLCDFKAKQKGTLKTHSSIHKNPSEIEWFK
ncbi:hypothetical protein NQ315_011051, partial [Exocentrus adspersus]